MSNTKCTLKDPFPTELLAKIDLGNMDGHRDSLVERGFIPTKSIQLFMQDRHSIIIGAFGSGKSAIFNLLENQSDLLEVFKKDLIVTINEQIQFDQLKNDAKIYFPNLSEKLTYQLLWKFQVCRRISEEIADLDGFPSNKHEEYINEFLNRTGGRGGYLTVLTRIKKLFETVSIKLTATLSDVPVDVELSKKAAKAIGKIEINLDKVIENSSKTIEIRNFRQCTVIIDKLDKFVAGEEYHSQKSYIESLLNLEDDLYSEKKIGFKIFLRSDLYERLNFSALGPDKAEDNTLRLSWSKDEIKAFVARRLFIALMEADIWSFTDIIESSDLSEDSLRWYEKIILKEEKSGFRYKFAYYCNKFLGRNKNKNQRTLFEKLDLAIINKLFSTVLIHENPEGKEQEIKNDDFFATHFLDGNDSCTPRYMLVFLKELIDEASEFYRNSPNIKVSPFLQDRDWVYNIFNNQLVYKAYVQSKEKYIRHVCKVDEKWSNHILELLEKKGGKATFDYKWIRKNVTFSKNADEEAAAFLIYLQVIGFLKISKYERDIRKRQFELPILYRKAVSTHVTI